MANKKNEIVQQISQGFTPVPFEGDFDLIVKKEIPIARLSTLGVGFDSVASALQHVVNNGQMGSGIYKVTVPAGGHLAAFKDGSGYLGSVLTEAGKVGGGQARINPLIIDPASLCMAIALMSIEKKLDLILEKQQEILYFLSQKEKAKLKAGYIFLSDVMRDYKLNWNNVMYKSNAHIKALDLKQEALTQIELHKALITKELEKHRLVQTQGDIKKKTSEIVAEFNDYQMAVYLYAMSSFAEVLLLGNFNSDFLNGVIQNISRYSKEYRSLYTKAYDALEKESKDSIDSFVLGGLSTATRGVGKAIGRIPLVNKTTLDENLISAGKSIAKVKKSNTNQTLKRLVSKQRSYVAPFEDSIRSLRDIYNNDIEMYIDDNTLYIGEVEKSRNNKKSVTPCMLQSD